MRPERSPIEPARSPKRGERGKNMKKRLFFGVFGLKMGSGIGDWINQEGGVRN
jgi:hypothetical protein